MHLPRFRIASFVIVASSACTAARDENPAVPPTKEPSTAAVADPLASFARFVGGEWQVVLASGDNYIHAWKWGPGNFSMRRMAHASDDATNPWVGEVLYWHPGLGQVRTLSVHEDIPAVGRGVAEGAITFDGETWDALIDLDQPRGRRKLRQRQIFEGPDRYGEPLLEDNGAGYQPLNHLEFVRIAERPKAPAPAAERAPLELPDTWRPFAALLGTPWKAERDSANGSAFRVHSTFEWVPGLEIVFARAVAFDAAGKATPLLEAYLFRDVRTDALRCLALSSRGGVYEGTVTVADGGALQLDLKHSEGDRVAPLFARIELGHDGRLRTRAWTLDGAARTLTLDVEHEKLATKRE